MWFLGHLALSLLAAMAVAHVAGREVSRKEFFLLMFFANLPDMLHLPLLRDVTTHNVFGGTLAFVVAYALLRRHVSWLAGVAYAFHYVGDFIFSSFRPLYPFVKTDISHSYGWNTPVNIFWEVVLGAILVVILWKNIGGMVKLEGPWPQLAVLATLALMTAQVGLFVIMNIELILTDAIYFAWVPVATAVCLYFTLESDILRPFLEIFKGK